MYDTLYGSNTLACYVLGTDLGRSDRTLLAYQAYLSGPDLYHTLLDT